VPISALITGAAIERDCFARGFTHVTSHASDPMPAAVALAVLDVVEEEHLADRARARGQYLLDQLGDLQDRHEQIGDVRGMGLLCGLELVMSRETREPADALGLALTDECQRRGLSINLVRGGTGGHASCLRMAPPLTVSEDEIDLAVTIIDDALRTVVDRSAAATAAS
jgi:2,2-dialkylglycine decarboxylase (pyruvate)